MGRHGRTGVLTNIQGTNAKYGNSPTLRLRGGGADQNRKEARKRKFGQYDSGAVQSQPVAEVGPQGAEQATRPIKKQKKDITRPQSSEPGVISDPENVSLGIEVIQPSDMQNGSPKPQRFIVFIGTQDFKLW